ncbi:MAG: leukotoxin LktA family filamentous adhesin [Parvibaculales bacterium]
MAKVVKQNGAKLISYVLGMTQVVVPPMAYAQSSSAQIVPDGRTQTALSVSGNVTDVRTQTIQGTTGLNSFSVFDVHRGNQVNLHLPDSTDNLINFVHDKETRIDGLLNAYKNGLVGGNVYFLNPYGIYVGESGIINAGQVNLRTPTHDFMANLFQPTGLMSPGVVSQVLSNGVPVSRTGLISVTGQINALEAVSVEAGRIDVSGAIETGEPARLAIENVVNSGQGDTQYVDLDAPSAAPDVRLAAETDLVITGRVAAESAWTPLPGSVHITAGDNLTAGNGADISADGFGDGSHGGTVVLFAQQRALIEDGARLSANATGDGDGGFVEFSARETVELAGGRLEATSETGADGTVLIDPENIVLSSDLLRDDGVADGGNSGGGTSWSAGALTLQADDTITLNANVTVSSRDVSNPSVVANHETGASIGNSGNITLEADNITLNSGAKILAHVEDGSTYAAGDVALRAHSENSSAISLTSATLSGDAITLDARAVNSPLSVYSNPLSTATSSIALTSSTISAAGNVSISATSLQDKAAATGALVSFDARTASASVSVSDTGITSAGNVSILSDADIVTDLTPTGWASFSTVLPLNVQAAVTTATATTTLDGGTSITATTGSTSVDSQAGTSSTLYAEANFPAVAFTGAVGVLTTRAETLIEGTTDIETRDSLYVGSQSNTISNAVADASSGAGGLSGALGFAVSLIDSSSTVKFQGGAAADVTGGDMTVNADNVLQNLTAARAANDATTEDAENAFSDGIDSTPGMDTMIGGQSIGDILKDTFNTALGNVTDSLTGGNDADTDGSTLQVAGAVGFSRVDNTTSAFIGTSDDAATVAPDIYANALTGRARSVVQSQTVGSGQAEDYDNGGSAGIGIQIAANEVSANIGGNENADLTLNVTDLRVQALTESYRSDVGNQNRFGVIATAGAPTAGEDGIGIAGAIAVNTNETNRYLAELDDDTDVTLSGNADTLVEATGDTRTTAVADGSDASESAVDGVFDAFDSDADSDGDGADAPAGGTVGFGASVAVATSNNETIARVNGGNTFSYLDDLTVRATANNETRTEADAGGKGGIAIIPVAAVTVARNTTTAELNSGTNLSMGGDLTVTADQIVTASAAGTGNAVLSGDDANAAIGMAAGLVISTNDVDAKILRSASTAGDVTLAALSATDITSGGQAGANGDDDDDDSNNEEESGNDLAAGTGAMVGMGNAFAGGDDVAVSDITDNLNTDTDALGGAANGAGDADENNSLTIAAAFAVNYLEDRTDALVGEGISLAGGVIGISANRNTDVNAVADASADSGSYNLGGAVGLNIVDVASLAEVDANAVISGTTVSVGAGMRSLIEGADTDSVNEIVSQATAGVGTGEFSLAGAVGLNVVLRNQSQALLDAGSTTTAGSGLSVTALADTSYTTKGKATVGDTNSVFTGIDGFLSSLDDMEALIDGVMTSLGVGDADDAEDVASDSGGEEEEGAEGNVGIGAGFGINLVFNDNTLAKVANTATLNGGAASPDLTVSATSTTATRTEAEAGAKPDEDSGSTAKTSLDAAVAVAIINKTVDASIGTGTNLDELGALSITATGTSDAFSRAHGEVEAEESAVGASVAVAVTHGDVTAALNRSVDDSTGITVSAVTDTTDVALADAVAAGTVVRDYADKLNIGESDLLGTDALSNSDDSENPSSLKALGGGFSDGDGASFDTTGDSFDGGSEGGDANQSGSVNIAASVSVNWTDHDTSATIADGVSLTSTGNISVLADSDVNYRTRGSGMAVFADNAIGVGVGILKTGQDTSAILGDNVTITSANNVSVQALTSENQGTDPNNNDTSFGGYASAEGIAGAGGGDLAVAGSLGLVYSDDSQAAQIGTGGDITNSGDLTIRSRATNKIVNRAWALAVASDATCSDPGNCNSDSNKTAVGASIAVNVVTDTNLVQLGEDTTVTSSGSATIEAEDLSPLNAEFILDPEDDSTSTEDYITGNYTTLLQNASYYAEAIAGGAAQGGNAGSGSLAVTASIGSTKALIGEGVSLTAASADIRAFNESDARHLVGAIAIAEKKAIGGSISGIYLREDVATIIGEEGVADGGQTTTIITNAGNMRIDAEADQETLTFMAAGGISTNELALSGALGVNVLDTDVETIIVEDAVLRATAGNVDINADSATDIRNFALSVSGSGGSDSAGGSLALNLFLTDKKALVGQAADANNNITIDATGALNVGVDASQEILNGVISASVSTSGNAISGALSANIIKGDSIAAVRQGADLNTDAGIDGAANETIGIIANDRSTITDLTGTLAASNSTSVGVALGANVFWKNVEASLNSTANAEGNIEVAANNEQNLTATVVGIAGSTGGLAGAGSVSVGLVKSTTNAFIGDDATVYTDGSIKLHAGDDTDIFMLEPAASFSTGGTALAGAVGAAVFIGTTRARVLGGATVQARGNGTVAVDQDSVTTSSPLLEGIMGGDDEQTRSALASFNDDFTFDNIKDLFLTEVRDTENKSGISVSATSDQDVISIAASGAVSSDNAIAISLSAGVGVNTTEASIANGATVTANYDGTSADVIVRAISDTYWTDLSAALGAGTGSAGVGVGGDIVIQVKNTLAYIGTGATVQATQDVLVEASNKDKIINSAATLGLGNSAGVAGTAAVGVLVNTTKAYIDGTVEADRDLKVTSDAATDLIQIAGGVGGGGTAGIGASFGVGYVKNTTEAYIDDNAVANASRDTNVEADTDENSVAAVIAGGIGGTVGVGVSAGIKIHQSNTRAFIKGSVNQTASFAQAGQDVTVRADNTVNTIDVVGGIGGGGTVGVGVSLNALVVQNNAQAYIGGGTNTRVSAHDDISVTAHSDKTTKNFTLAGAAAGTVSVAGNVAVILVGADADDESNEYMEDGEGGSHATHANDRINAIDLGSILSDDNSSGDYARTGDTLSEVASVFGAQQGNADISATFNPSDSNLSRNKTQAFIENGATVSAGRDLTIDSEDTINTIFTAGAVGGAGVVGVGATVGVLVFNTSSEAYIGTNAVVNVSEDLTINSETQESVGSGALSAGGAGITSVQGVVMTQATYSRSRAFIEDSARVNQGIARNNSQTVSLLAESDTDLVTFSGSGGGALVGVGITGDVMILEKETRAWIGENALVASGGDIAIDARSQEDLLQIAMSINGGFVGVTGTAGVVVASNTTEAVIEDGATVAADDSMRIQATDDTEIDAILITGAGGAVGVGGAIGTYVMENVTRAKIGDNAVVTALAEAAGDGIDALTGVIDNSNLTTQTRTVRQQDQSESDETITSTNTEFVNANARGLVIGAVTNEDINLAPVGVAIGAVGVAGTIATTVSESTVEALVGTGTTLNANNTGAGNSQDVRLLAQSETLLNNISTGLAYGGVGVALDVDTQVYAKTVRARLLGDATAKRDISVLADNRDRVIQTMVSSAVGATDGIGGLVGTSVIADTVLAEIGDTTTTVAERDVIVDAEQDIDIVQTGGNVSGGGAGSGVGASLGTLVAKSTNTARIGSGATVTAYRTTRVDAESDTSLNQNIIGFGGGGTAAIVGSIGINVLKTSTLAEIGADTSVNATANAAYDTAQSIIVRADDVVTTQGAAGAGAIGGAAGVGVGVTVTVTRNATAARVGNNAVLKARDDVTITADSEKNISNQGIAAAGGIGLGAAGSVALTLVGGAMSEDGGDQLTNDNGNMLAEADTASSRDRSQNQTQDNNGNTSNGGMDNASTSRLDGYDTQARVDAQMGGVQADVEGSGTDSTFAGIGTGVTIETGDDVTIGADEEINLSQIAGGAAFGTVGVGGFVAVGEYNGSVTAQIGDNSTVTLGGDIAVRGTLDSGDNISIDVPVGDDITVGAVNSTVVGATGGILGATLTVAQLNLNEDVTAEIGDSVTISSTSGAADTDVDVIATRDVDAETNVVGLAAGVVAAGVSVGGINASGNATARIGNDSALGTDAARLGALTVQALNSSTQKVRAVSGGVGYFGAGVGATSLLTDSGDTSAVIGNNTSLYGGGLLTVSSDDRARNYGNSVGVAVSAGVSMSGIISRVSADRNAYTTIGDNTTLVGNGLTLSATIGETGQNMADSDVVGATGGLVAATGSETTVTADADTKLEIGDNAVLKSNRLVGGGEVSGAAVNLSATNRASIDNNSTAVVAGAAALGVHITRSTSTGDSRIIFGANTDLVTMSDIAINALSDRDSRAEAIAGAGGLVAANGAESIVTHSSNVLISVADGSAAGNGIGIATSGSLTVTAVNNDTYDAAMDAGAVALGGVTGAVARTTGRADTSISFGDYADITSNGLVVTADNNLSKSGLDENFKFDGGGALSVTAGDSKARQTQNALISFGDNSSMLVTGTLDAHQDAVITSRVNVTADDEAIINTGALIGVPVSMTEVVANSTAGIDLGANSDLVTRRGDITLLADTLSDIDSDARTSVWGLAGVGATGQSKASMTGRNTVNIGTGSEVIANGYLYANAGREASLNSIVANTNIYNNTLIAGIFGEKAEAALTINSDVNIAENAALRSAQYMVVESSTGSGAAVANGYKEWLQYIGIAVVPLNGSFGAESVSGRGNINLAGTLETGVYNEQYIGFGTGFGSFREDPNSPGDVEKMTLTESDGVYTRSDGTIMDVPVVGTYSDDKTVTLRSSDAISWSFDLNRDPGQDIDLEINELEVAKLRSFNSDAADALADKQTELLADQTFYQNLQSGAMTAQDVLDNLNDDLTTKQAELTAAQDAGDPTAAIQQEIDDLQAQIDNFDPDSFSPDAVDYTAELADIATQLDDIQTQIDDFDSSGDPATVAKINNEIAFLEAKKANLNDGPVDIISVGDIFAATGHVYTKADNLTGASTGQIISNNNVSVTIRNDSNSPIEVNNIEVSRTPGGNIYFNDVLVETEQNVRSLNRDGAAETGFAMTSSPGNFTTMVQIDGRFDPNSSAYNPDTTVPIKAPAMLMEGMITNRAGSVNVVNKNGSIYSNGSIEARRIKVTSGGAFFVNDKTPGIYNIGASPTSDTRDSASDPVGYGDVAAARTDNIGQPDGDLGGCGTIVAMPFDSNNSEPCAVGTVNQSDDESARLFGDEVYIVANTINVNGLIQSGVAQKSITIGETYDAFTDNDGVSSYTLEDVALDLSGTGSGREGVNGVTAEYNAAEDVIEISGLEAKGGKVTLVGKLISTGNGAIKVLDGYGTFNVTNNSDKDVRINYANTGEVEGIVTLIDDAYSDANGVPRVTQYTRVGDTVSVRNNVGVGSSNPTNLVSSTSGRSSSYAIKDGMRYYWIEGESLEITRTYRTNRRKKTFIGINVGEETNFRPPDSSFTSQEIPASSLPSADFAAVDTSVTSDYTFRMRYDETYYNRATSTENLSCYTVGLSWAPLYQDCSWVNVTTENSNGSLFYYQDVSADRSVPITFIGQDTGTLNVTSAGGIQIGGEITALNTTTTLTANGGDISMSNANGYIEVGDITMTASGRIGSDARAVKLVQEADDTITASAGTGVKLTSDNGNLRFAQLTNVDGDVILEAGENIYLNTQSNILVGDTVSLRANYGEIADTSGNAVRVNTLDGTFSAYSRAGNINVVETEGDISVRQINTVGDVTLATLNGSILDGNTEQTDDAAAQAALLALWTDLQLTEDTGALDKRNDQIAGYNRSMEQLYQDYYTLRNLSQEANGAYVYDDYDVNFSYTATTEERQAIATGSLVSETNALYQDYWSLRQVQQDADGNYVATAYNPNFIYVPSEAETAALDNDPDLIAQLQLDQQARYQLGYERFGDPDYDPDFDYTDTAVTQLETIRTARYQQAYETFGDPVYVADFTYEAPESQTNLFTQGFAWDAEHLEAPLPGQAFKDITDTTAFVEDSNIIGDDITLTAGSGNIGVFTDTTQFEIAKVYAKELTDEQKVLLSAAESDDVEYNETTGMVTLTQREDLDIQTLNETSVINVTAANGFGFIGGETSLNVNSVAVSGELRVKVSGEIQNIRADDNPAVSSDNLVLEASTGAIGSADKAMIVQVDDGFRITARAQEGIWLEEATGNVNIGQIFSPTGLVLTAPGDILDANTDLITDIKSNNVTLRAGGSFGVAAADGDSDTVIGQKALDIASTSVTDSTFDIETPGGGAALYVSNATSLRLTRAMLAGNLDLMTIGDARFGGSFNTNGNRFGLTSFSDVVFDDAANAVFDNTQIDIAASADMRIDSLLDTQGGGVVANIVGALTVGSDGEVLTRSGVLQGSVGQATQIAGVIDTQGGDISATLLDSLTLAETGTVRLGGGDLTLAVSEATNLAGLLDTQGGSVSATLLDSLTLAETGTVRLGGGNLEMSVTQAANLAGLVDTAGGNITATLLDSIDITGTLTTAGGNITATVADSFTLRGAGRIETVNGDFTIDANQGFNQTVSLTDTAVLDVSAGRILIEASGQATVTGIRTQASGDDAVTLRALDIQEGGDDQADIARAGTGTINLFAGRYINLNDITNTNADALRLNVAGKSGLGEVRTGAVMLGLNSLPGTVFERLYADHAGILETQSDYLQVVRGITQQDAYFTVSEMNARIGRLKERTLEPQSWTVDDGMSSFFDTAALAFGGRQENYSVTGGGNYLNNPNSLLFYDFLYDNPEISSTGIAVTWSPRFILARGEAERQRIDQRIDMALASILQGANYVSDVTQTSAFVTTLSSLDGQAPVVSVPAVGLAQDQTLTPTIIFDGITVDDDFLWIAPEQQEDNGFVNLSSLSDEGSEPLVRLE